MLYSYPSPFLRSVFIVLFVLALQAGKLDAQVAPALIPLPTQAQFTQGHLDIPSTSLLYISKGTKDIKALWVQLTGWKLKTTKRPQEARIRLYLDKGMAEDAYRLEVTADSLVIRSRDRNGWCMALQTLKQCIDPKQPMQVPCCAINDQAAYHWRGAHLDAGRHFMPVDIVKQYLDWMAMYKLNVFHWHLTEDQGWRIEIKKYPKLTQVAAWRTENDGSRTGGFYTQKQIKEIIAYAANYGIRVVPEIEIPGHCMSALVAYPYLGCTGGPYTVPNGWGVFSDVYCPGKETTFQFLEGVLTEVMDLFPDTYIHIGGDEVPRDRWSECKDCAKRIATEKLKGAEDLYGYTMQRIHKLVVAHHKTMIGWDEMLDAKLSSSAAVEIWRGEKMAETAIAEGRQWLSTCYLDAPSDRYTTEQVYQYTPDFVKGHHSSMGAEACVWTESITPAKLPLIVLPRLIALAERLWSPQYTDYKAFSARLAVHKQRLVAGGIVVGPDDKALWSLSAKWDRKTGYWKAMIKHSLDGVTGQVTTDCPDGNKINASFNDSAWICPGKPRVNVCYPGNVVQESRTYTITNHIGVGAGVTFKKSPSPKYGADHLQGMSDGLCGSPDFHDGQWYGWEGDVLDCTIDLAKTLRPVRFDSLQSIQHIAMRCLQETRSWIFMPKQVHFYLSKNGKDWTEAATVSHKVSEHEEKPTINNFELNLPARQSWRYVRVVADNFGTLPSWHPGASGKPWIFADEVIIE